MPGNPVIVSKEGKEIALSEMKLMFDQHQKDPKNGVDYDGGPIKMARLISLVYRGWKKAMIQVF